MLQIIPHFLVQHLHRYDQNLCSNMHKSSHVHSTILTSEFKMQKQLATPQETMDIHCDMINLFCAACTTCLSAQLLLFGFHQQMHAYDMFQAQCPTSE